MTSEPFCKVTRDELLLLDGQRVLESRLMCGVAEQTGAAIRARDDVDGELRALCDGEHEVMRSALARFREGRARVVTSATREEGRAHVASTVALTILDLSLVSTPQHVATDYETLVDLASVRPQTTQDDFGLPVVWRNGSGAVLLHEAAGHPAEHGHAAMQWPPWLTAVDESDLGTANLLAGECPLRKRRESFSDVPLSRMTRVVVGSAETTALPPHRIDVHLVAGGSYEALTQTITLSVSAADLVDGGRSVRMRPFEIRDSRASMARAVRGAAGGVRRYPGVICSREGQQLYVASYAPDLITEF